MTDKEQMPEQIWCQHTDSRGEHLQRWWSSPDWPHNTTQYTRTDTLNQQEALSQEDIAND